MPEKGDSGAGEKPHARSKDGHFESIGRLEARTTRGNGFVRGSCGAGFQPALPLFHQFHSPVFARDSLRLVQSLFLAVRMVVGLLVGFLMFGTAQAQITSAVPDYGPVVGATPIRLEGNFAVPSALTSVAQAQAAYNIYFDGELAKFDVLFPELVTSTAMYVKLPRKPDGLAELVDIEIADLIDGTPSVISINGFNYFEPIMDIIDEFGPTAGGNPITITVGTDFTDSGLALSAFAAALRFTVLFDGVPGAFIDLPFTLAAEVDDDLVLTLQVVPPAHAMEGFVDVAVIDKAPLLDLIRWGKFKGYLYSDGINRVVPDSGPVTGGIPIRVEGTFPIDIDTPITNLAVALSSFEVRFGGLAAAWDTSFFELATATNMYVILPVKFDGVPALVDVDVIDKNTPANSLRLVDGFAYFEPIVDIVPDFGPTSGGNQVTITVDTNVLDAGLELDADMANMRFQVFFDEIPGEFDASFAVAAAVYGTYQWEFHVLPPPHPLPEIVDVEIMDMTFSTAVNRWGRNHGYTYILGSGGIDQWIECAVRVPPDPPLFPISAIGAVGVGELEVEVEVTGSIDTRDLGTSVFIVPQGGDPAEPNDRILLVQSAPQGPTNIWVGTNVDPIETVMIDEDGSGGPSAGDLFADGHAAVFLEVDFEVIGDEIADFTEGGLIGGNALIDRHFLIDTIPPVMVTNVGGDTADTLVFLSSGTIGLPTGNPGPDFPFPTLPPDPPNADEGLITNTPNDPVYSKGAQIFFNIASVSNAFLPDDETLKIFVEVVFVDEDLHEHFGFQTSLRDEDLFLPGNFLRQPSGFDAEIDIITGGDVDDLLRNGDVARWRFLADSLPTITDPPGIERTLTPFSIDVALGFFDPLDINNVLNALWDLTTDGIPTPNQEVLHLELQFQAHDIAGAENGAIPPNVTELDFLLDPLHIWWIRDVGTRLSPDVEGTENSNPLFSWKLDRGFDTGARGISPLFSYRLYTADNPSGIKSADYDNDYVNVNAWSSWTSAKSLQLDNQNYITNLGLTTNSWYMMVVVGSDEAGNVEPIPADEILSLDSDANALRVIAARGSNWKRFFVPSVGGQYDTVIEATFWHDQINADASDPDGVRDIGEEQFGSASVVPSPNDLRAKQLRGEFRITVSSDGPDAPEGLEVVLFRNGEKVTNTPLQFIASEFIKNTLVLQIGGPDTVAPLPLNVVLAFQYPLGDQNPSASLREPVSYLLRATTLGPGAEADSTPANLLFTVVGDVAEYIENRASDDAQPIKIVDR